jgi:hypothetical protein
MDLKGLTEMQLLDLRKKINDELESYKDRGKTKVFTVFIAFEGTKYFLEKDNALEYLNECIGYDMVFDGNDVTLSQKFLNEAEVKNFCQDYNQKDESLPRQPVEKK